MLRVVEGTTPCGCPTTQYTSWNVKSWIFTYKTETKSPNNRPGLNRCRKEVGCWVLEANAWGELVGANKQGCTESSKVIGWRSVLHRASRTKRTSRTTEREILLCFRIVVLVSSLVKTVYARFFFACSRKFGENASNTWAWIPNREHLAKLLQLNILPF